MAQRVWIKRAILPGPQVAVQLPKRELVAL
jgi:hypothetical protein